MNALQRRMLQRLGELKQVSTMCPGQLARDCGTTLREARGGILALVHAGRIALSQRGKPAAPKNLKGPFRVRLR